MKEILVAAVTGAILLTVTTVLLQLYHIEHRARALLYVYIGCCAVLVAIYILTPDDLGLLPKWAVSPSKAIGLLFSAFLYTAGFFGGILQLYNLADRGLSLRMLIDIAESPARAMSAAEMVKSYSAGQGLVWMYDKRLRGMLETELITSDGQNAYIRPKGRRVAELFAWCRLVWNGNSNEP